MLEGLRAWCKMTQRLPVVAQVIGHLADASVLARLAKTGIHLLVTHLPKERSFAGAFKLYSRNCLTDAVVLTGPPGTGTAFGGHARRLIQEGGASPSSQGWGDSPKGPFPRGTGEIQGI